MAFRATTRYWRSMAASIGSSRSFVSSTPKMKLFASSAVDASHASHHHHHNKYTMTGEFAPVYVVLGMLLIAASIGGHTAKQQLVHSPSVYISKKRRKTFPEVVDPDCSIDKADKFINKSFLRKVGHIQDHNHVLGDATSRNSNPFTRPRNAETLKSVGVEPGRN